MLLHKGGQINSVQLITGVRIVEMLQLQNCSVMCTKNGSNCENKNNKKLAASKTYSKPPTKCRSKSGKLSKIIFSALNFFMHIFSILASAEVFSE